VNCVTRGVPDYQHRCQEKIIPHRRKVDEVDEYQVHLTSDTTQADVATVHVMPASELGDASSARLSEDIFLWWHSLGSRCTRLIAT